MAQLHVELDEARRQPREHLAREIDHRRRASSELHDLHTEMADLHAEIAAVRAVAADAISSAQIASPADEISISAGSGRALGAALAVGMMRDEIERLRAAVGDADVQRGAISRALPIQSPYHPPVTPLHLPSISRCCSQVPTAQLSRPR